MRGLIVVYRTYRRSPFAARVHTIVRFLTCPFLRVVPFVPAGATLLEIGAGHGVFARLARERGARRAIAVEPDLRKLHAVDGIDVVAGFDSAIRGTFDVVAIVDVLYKVPIAEWDAFLSRAAARVAPGGMLLIKEQDPTARIKNSWNRGQEWLASKLRLTLGASFSYEAPAAFVARLQRLGLDARAVRIDRGYPHPHILYVSSRPTDK